MFSHGRLICSSWTSITLGEPCLPIFSQGIKIYESDLDDADEAHHHQHINQSYHQQYRQHQQYHHHHHHHNEMKESKGVAANTLLTWRLQPKAFWALTVWWSSTQCATISHKLSKTLYLRWAKNVLLVKSQEASSLVELIKCVQWNLKMHLNLKELNRVGHGLILLKALAAQSWTLTQVAPLDNARNSWLANMFYFAFCNILRTYSQYIGKMIKMRRRNAWWWSKSLVTPPTGF